MDAKTTSRESFLNAVIYARMYCRKNNRKNQVAYLCELFLDANKGLINKFERLQKKLIAGFNLQLDCKRSELGTEKDGKLILDGTGSPALNKEKNKEFLEFKKTHENNIDEAMDMFMEEMIECKATPYEKEIPIDMDYDTQKALGGFVLILKTKFEDEKKEENKAA